MFESVSIDIIWIAVSVLILAVSLGFFSIAACIYVAFRFLSLALSMDASLLREFKVFNQSYSKIADNSPINAEKLKSFISERLAPTEGDFIPYSDEEAFINEQVAHLKSQGLTDEELEAFVKQAVGNETVLPPKPE